METLENTTKTQLTYERLLGNVDSFSNRIKNHPLYSDWLNDVCGFADNINEETCIDFEGLNDHEKLALFIKSYSDNDMCVFKRHCAKYFNWSEYKVAKLVKEINAEKTKYWIDFVPTFNESNGLLSGKGYQFFNVA
jgi:hypothetical protein